MAPNHGACASGQDCPQSLMERQRAVRAGVSVPVLSVTGTATPHSFRVGNGNTWVQGRRLSQPPRETPEMSQGPGPPLLQKLAAPQSDARIQTAQPPSFAWLEDFGDSAINASHGGPVCREDMAALTRGIFANDEGTSLGGGEMLLSERVRDTSLRSWRSAFIPVFAN